MPAGRPSVLETSETFNARTRVAVVVSAALVFVGGFAAGFAGCYRPAITDGGYQCAAVTRACPEGLGCADDGHCWVHPIITTPPVDSGMETMMMMTDAGGDGSMCVPTPLCQDQPATGDVCSPSCQTGCGCDRCNVLNGKPTCGSVGKAKLGELCTPGTIDNCAPGLFCRTEVCGNGLARCYRHCTTNDQCDGSACTLAINDTGGAATSYLTCDVPSSGCDPVANSGCPDPALNCYLTSANQRLCDCPGPTQGQNGAACLIYSDCAPGYVCVGAAGGDGGDVTRCRFVCSVAHPSCTVTAPNCIPSGTGAQFGYCSP